MQIEYFKKNVYGIEKLYIKNEETAQIIRNLTGKKTIDERDMESLGKLGVTFIQVLN